MLSHCRSELKFNENAAPWAATQGAGLARERRTASNLLIRSSERRLCRRFATLAMDRLDFLQMPRASVGMLGGAINIGRDLYLSKICVCRTS